jgi:hypothetical protein
VEESWQHFATEPPVSRRALSSADGRLTRGADRPRDAQRYPAPLKASISAQWRVPPTFSSAATPVSKLGAGKLWQHPALPTELGQVRFQISYRNHGILLVDLTPTAMVLHLGGQSCPAEPGLCGREGDHHALQAILTGSRSATPVSALR